MIVHNWDGALFAAYTRAKRDKCACYASVLITMQVSVSGEPMNDCRAVHPDGRVYEEKWSRAEGHGERRSAWVCMRSNLDERQTAKLARLIAEEATEEATEEG